MACAAGGASAAEVVVVEEPVVVVARPSPIGQQPDVAPRVVYQADELARFGAQNLGELLRRLPGVAFTSEAGQYESPQLRGIGPEYTQLLIDGRRVPGLAEDRSAFVDRIPSDLIERVEIVRSPTADLDAQGIGGSINVILRAGAAADGMRLRLGTVVDDAGRARVLGNVGAGSSRGPWSAYLGLTLQPAHEARGKRADTYAANGTLLGRRSGEEVRDGRSTAADARTAYRFDGGGTLALDAQFLRTRRDTRLRETGTEDAGEGPVSFGTDEREDEDQTTRGAGLRATLPLDADFHCAAGLDRTALSARRSARVDRTAEGATARSEDEALSVHDREVRADARCTLAHAAGHRLRFGASGGQQRRRAQDRRTAYEDGQPIDLSPYGGAYRIDERRADVFVQTLWTLATRWELDTGLRLETSRRDPSAASSGTPARRTADRQWLPNLHLRWSPTGEAQVRASLARTLRRPEFGQLAPFRKRVDEVFFIGNPDLAPERALGADLGYAQRWPGAGLALDANLFYRRIDDLIQNESLAADTRRPVNVGRGRVRGLELESSVELDPLGLRGARLRTALTLLDSRVREPATGQSQRFQRQPPYVFTLAYDQALASSGIGWGLALSRQGDAREALADSIENLRFGTGLEAYVSIGLGPDTTLRIAGHDLLDARVVDTTRGFEGPRPAGALESIDRERETLGPSLLIAIEAGFR